MKEWYCTPSELTILRKYVMWQDLVWCTSPIPMNSAKLTYYTGLIYQRQTSLHLRKRIYPSLCIFLEVEVGTPFDNFDQVCV